MNTAQKANDETRFSNNYLKKLTLGRSSIFVLFIIESLTISIIDTHV